MIKYRFLLISALASLLVFSESCHTRRNDYIKPIREQGPDYLFEQLKKNEFRFETLSLKFNVESEVDNQNTSFSGHLQIIHDSTIWISIQKFGLEAARLLITSDTCKMMNRIDNTYFIGGFEYVNSILKTDFDFDMIQAIITGNDFAYYENDIFKAGIENKKYKLSTLGRRKLKKYIRHEKEIYKVLVQDIWLSPETFKIEHSLLKEVKDDNRKFESFYSDFTDVNGQLFPTTFIFEIQETKKIKGTVTYNKISTATIEALPFRIPQNYTRMQ